MSTDPVVVLTASPRGWAGRLRAHAADHGGALIRATVLTREDALAEQCSVVVLDDITSFLTPAFISQLHERGRAVLGVYDASDSHGKGDLIDAGVDAVIEADADIATFVSHIGRLALVHPDERPQRPPHATAPGTSSGRLVGVTGPAGGVGVTEIALEVAATVAASKGPTALVDVDEGAPCLAQRLGIGLHPNLHTATERAERTGRVDDCLQPLATRRPLDVLTGMASGEDWTTVRPGAVAAVSDRLRSAHDVVVLDLGHLPVAVEGPTGLRFGHGRRLTPRCDTLIVATTATPVAIARTIDLLAGLSDQRRRTHLVLNRIGVDRYVRDEAVTELRAATAASTVHVVHEDPKVGRASWQGSRVPRGTFRRDVGQMVEQLGLLG